MKKAAPSAPRIAVFFSDLHVGSTAGLLQPDFTTHEGYKVVLNSVQEWLWGCWQDCWKWAHEVIGKDPWIAVVNGDLIDGNHHDTREIWSPDDADHGMACSELLRDTLKGSSAVYVTEGTNVHVQNSEHGIAASLAHDLPVRKPGGKLAAWPELRLSIAGSYCEIDHHMPTTMRSYLEASQLSITLGDIRNQRAREGGRIPKLIVRSHRHRFGLYEDGYGMMLALPGWQASGRFLRRVAPGIVPQVGLCIADWRHVEDGGTPVIHKRLHTVKASLPSIA